MSMQASTCSYHTTHRGLGLSLCAHDDAGLLLDRLVDEERRAQCRLLRNLLGLDGVRELGREGDVRDGDVVEHEVEAPRAHRQVLAHQARHHLALRDELRGVELRDDALEHLCSKASAWQDRCTMA